MKSNCLATSLPCFVSRVSIGRFVKRIVCKDAGKKGRIEKLFCLYAKKLVNCGIFTSYKQCRCVR